MVIAHRLSTIRHADKIIVLKKGKLTEIGNHETLLRDYPTGVYSKLVRQQEQAEENGESNSDEAQEQQEKGIDEVP